MQDPIPAPNAPAAGAPQRSLASRIAARLAAVAVGLIMAWLLLEVLLRVLFFSLPPKLQLGLEHVKITPFSDTRLMPDPLWQADIDYLTIARPVTDFDQYGSADVHFKVNTATLWGQRGAFRTTQDAVDRYVDGVAVGDSFTFCFTDDADCWVQELATITDRNLINLGVVSTGSVSHLRILEAFGAPLKPPLVLWQWYGNDANEDYGLARLRDETPALSEDAGNTSPRSWLDENSAVYVTIKLITGHDDEYEDSLQFLDPKTGVEGSIRLAFGRPYLWGAFDLSLPANAYGWQRSQQALRDAQSLVETWDGSLVVLLMPTKEQVYRTLADPLVGADHMALLDDNYAAMLDFCAQADLTCIDLLPVFQTHAKAGEQLYYTTDIHLNAAGNVVLADALAEWLDAHPEIFSATP
jgi:hypothetical protein